MTRALRTWAARAVETLDDPHADDAVVLASLRDIARINHLFGGAAAAARRVDEFLAGAPAGAALTLLDVGTGGGDIPRRVARVARRRGIELRLIGLERHRAAAREAARAGGLSAILADGARLPLRGRSVDLVLCSKVLHHAPGEAGRRLIAELDRVARIAVVVADIRRSAVAAAGIWVAGHLLGFHPATRRDGVISVFRGFTRAELLGVCASAGVRASVRSHPGWCLTAAWRPAAATA